MEFSFKTINSIPVLYTDEFYNEEELDAMFYEAEKIRQLDLLTSDSTSGATIQVKNKDTGEIKTEGLSNNQSVWFDKIYAGEKRLSDTLRIVSKIYDGKLIDYLASLHPYFITMRQNKRTGTLLSYYDESEHYKNHRDSSFVTVLTWLYKEPKAFKGGEFVIENDLKIECVRGRVVFMPSYALHSVVPVVMPKDKIGKGLGRYTVTQFVEN
tara:strand:+ start:257 stop:889 length:633 start_codon:yes stop_codon:yes gene_type:complete